MGGCHDTSSAWEEAGAGDVRSNVTRFLVFGVLALARAGRSEGCWSLPPASEPEPRLAWMLLTRSSIPLKFPYLPRPPININQWATFKVGVEVAEAGWRGGSGVVAE